MPSKKTLDEALHVRLLIDNPDRLEFIDLGKWKLAPSKPRPILSR
jgi:hypothetical protein